VSAGLAKLDGESGAVGGCPSSGIHNPTKQTKVRKEYP